MFGDEDRVEFLALGGFAPGDDGDRLNGRGIQAREISQLIVLVVRHRRPDLLDREHAAGQVYEAHNVAGNAAGQCRE